APESPRVLDEATFTIVPHVNPDGAVANASWTNRPSIDLETCLEGIVREGPGDDVEFGYPDERDEPVRPENEAVARFLSESAPLNVFASLHGMLISGGAWFLIAREAVARTSLLRAQLNGLCRRLGVPLHDVDRAGEKGFFRIEPGFATTPTSRAMRDHFLSRGDEATARLFRASSMELVATRSPDVIALVSELPLFLLREKEGTRPTSADRFAQIRDRLAQARASPASSDRAPLDALRRELGLEPFPRAVAARLQLALVFLAAGLARPEAFLPAETSWDRTAWRGAPATACTIVGRHERRRPHTPRA